MASPPTADLMNTYDSIRSDQLQQDPPLHPELPAITTGRSHSTPTFWTVSLDKTNADVVLDIGDGRTAVGRGMSFVGPAGTNGDRAFLRHEGPTVEVRF